MTPAIHPILPPRDGFFRCKDPFMPQHTITYQFQALLTTFPGLLFSFRSRYYCAIGFEEYLVLEVDDPQVHARIPTRTTRDSSSPNIGMRTGLSPSVANRSRIISASDVWLNGRLTTPHVPEGIRFELCRFRSPLLTTSRLISLPPPTEMFQFGGFPILTDRFLRSRRSH